MISQVIYKVFESFLGHINSYCMRWSFKNVPLCHMETLHLMVQSTLSKKPSEEVTEETIGCMEENRNRKPIKII